MLKSVKRKHCLGILLLLLMSSPAFAQFTVSGKVTADLTGEELPGVYVLVNNSQQGVVTDLNGNYKIEVPGASGALTFSFVGYNKETFEVNAQTGPLNVVLTEDLGRLEEVVVTGLATTVKRSNLANAVSTISADELVGTTSQPTLDGAIYGKVTGANIVQSSGAPGGGIAIRLRGVSSITGQNQPLFIVDGVYLSNAEIPSGLRNASGANSASEENASNRIADLNPDDIESLEILKGPSAAAIYGTRANAGVVIITTKRGKEGRTQVNLSQDFGVNRAINLLGMRDWTADRVRDSFSEEEAQRFLAAQQAGKIYDYEEEIYGETGPISQTNLSVTGGGEKTKFFLGASVRNEDGIIKNTGFDRNSIRLNIDHKISDRFSISTGSNYVNSKTNRGFTGNENEGGLSYGYNLAFTRPWVDLHPDEFGNYPNNPNSSGNPLFVRDRTINEEGVNRFIQSAQLKANIIRSDRTLLTATLSGGLDFFTNETFIYVPKEHQGQGVQQGFIGQGKNNVRNLNNQGFLVWENFLNDGKLALTSQAGYSYLSFDRSLTYNQGTQLRPGPVNIGQAAALAINQTNQTEEEFGLVFQQEANFGDKVIATAGIRADKSNLNSDPNKYYYFPKASVAVNVGNFDFWNVSAVNQFKVRAAYGETGSTASFGSLYTPLTGVGIGGEAGFIVAGQRGRDDLEPETASEIEFGVDLGFFDSRIGLEATYYNRNVKDLILQRALPSSSGYTIEIANLADLRNSGLELGLNAVPVQSNKFTWTSTTNFWFNRSEVTRLDVPAFAVAGSAFGLSLGTFYVEEGEPITQLKGSVDGVVTTVGDAEPDFQLSFFNQFKILENFDFSFLLHRKQGGDNLNLTRLLTDLGQVTPDLDTEVGQARQNQPIAAPRFVEDASYWRMREMALYYTLPSSVYSGFASNLLSRVKVGVSARNLFTITNYSSYDPEVSAKGGSGLSTGVEVTPFPSMKQYYFHLSIGL